MTANPTNEKEKFHVEANIREGQEKRNGSLYHHQPAPFIPSVAVK